MSRFPAFVEIIQNGNGHAGKKQRGHFTGHKRYGKTLKYRIKQYNRSSYNNCSGCKHHGPEANGSRIYDCKIKRHTL